MIVAKGWVWREHEYLSGFGNLSGEIISAKRHYPSLIWEIIPPSIGSGHPDKYSYETSKNKYKQL